DVRAPTRHGKLGRRDAPRHPRLPSAVHAPDYTPLNLRVVSSVVPYDASMPKLDKTQAMRTLDARGIAYTVKQYDASGEFHSADVAAEIPGVDAAFVYKTLVLLRDSDTRAKPLLVMVPSTSEIDLRTLATSVGAKKLRMAKLAEAEKLTGMQAGGISVLAL